jgi:hypothetical protein
MLYLNPRLARGLRFVAIPLLPSLQFGLDPLPTPRLSVTQDLRVQNLGNLAASLCRRSGRRVSVSCAAKQMPYAVAERSSHSVAGDQLEEDGGGHLRRSWPAQTSPTAPCTNWQ